MGRRRCAVGPVWPVCPVGPVCAAVLMTGCNVGPRYARPEVVTPAAFKEASAEAYKGLPPGTWHPAAPQDAALKGRWWQIFGEPELDALEEQLDINNQTIAQTFQNFMAARAQVAVARAGYFPTVSLNPTFAVSGGSGGASTVGLATGAGVAASGAGGTVGAVPAAATTSSSSKMTVGTYYSIPLQASWAPDLWDRVRNTVREYRYAAQVSAADLENERLTEQAALAEYYFELRGQDTLTDLYNRTIAADRQSLELTRAQAETGVGTPEAVAQAEVTLENAEATAVGVATNRALYEHAIATLVGRSASDFSVPFRSLVAAPPPLPLVLPSQLLERRPDIAAAERTMAQANALIGVEKAAYYPSFNLAASGGLASFSLGSLFSLPSLFWSLGVSASETIFEGGLRDATVAQYTAMYRADVAAYRQTVLTAFQQVEDYVATLRIVSQQIAKQEVAVKSAQRYLDIALASYQTGINPYLDVITAQTLLLTGEQTLITLRVSALTAAVQLVQALGGGWERGRLPTDSEVTEPAGLKKVSGP